MTPLLTRKVAELLMGAARNGAPEVDCSLDLDRTRCRVEVLAGTWRWQGSEYPLPGELKERTVYAWDGAGFAPVARFSGALLKLVPTDWGPPTFEIDGIKMLPTARVSPLDDARRKVALVSPTGKSILDTCGGLGYFAGCCLEAGAAEVHSFEKNADVLWLRSLNPWSPGEDPRLRLVQGDIAIAIEALPSRSFGALLHDPPRFGIAGELYSQRFYDQLARVLKVRGKLFHYTGSPNRLTSGRDVPGEVMRRLERAGFDTRREGDGVLAVRKT